MFYEKNYSIHFGTDFGSGMALLQGRGSKFLLRSQIAMEVFMVMVRLLLKLNLRIRMF